MLESIDPTYEPLVHEGHGAARQLADLGLAVDVLNEALDAGDVAARQANRFSPVTAAGTLRWMETVRMLREGLAIHGWRPNDDRNSPRSIAPSGRLALVAVSGTVGTGQRDGTPRTANPRGKASSRAVQINGQRELNLSTLLADMSAEKTSGLDTWFLLYYRASNDELRAELSLPVRISERGVVDSWRERILLTPRSFGAEIPLPEDAGGSDDVDFDIAAR